MHGHIVKNRVLLSQLRELFIPVVVVNQHETGGVLCDDDVTLTSGMEGDTHPTFKSSTPNHAG